MDAHKTSNGTAPKRTGARTPSRSTARERHHCSATRLAVTESRGGPHDALKQAHTGPRSVQIQGKSASRDATATSPHAKTTHELEDDDPPRPGTNLEPTRFEWAVSRAMRHAYPWASAHVIDGVAAGCSSSAWVVAAAPVEVGHLETEHRNASCAGSQPPPARRRLQQLPLRVARHSLLRRHEGTSAGRRRTASESAPAHNHAPWHGGGLCSTFAAQR